MLNFNTIENSYAHPVALNSVNYVTSSGSQSTNTTSISLACHQPSITNEVMHTTARDQQQQQQLGGNWTTNENIQSATTTIDGNCTNRNDDYIQTVISENNGTDRHPINAAHQYLQHKGSENVKRFSVNNLLQLANNHRLAVGKLN